MRNQEEHDNQVAVINWCRIHETRHPDLETIFAIPNGGARHPAVARKLKAEGVKSGVSDLFLSTSSDKYHGLYIEMKSRDGKLTTNQIDWLCKMSKRNYDTATCHSWITAVNAIVRYLNLPKSMLVK